MKSSLFSLVAAVILFASSAATAAPVSDPGRDLRRMSPIERSRYEKAQRENERRQAQERARLEAQRREAQRQAAERARYEAQHRHDRGHDSRR